MAKTRKEKEKIAECLIKKLEKMKSLVFSDYQGLAVQELEELRKKIKKQGGEYLVVKKTLLNLALRKTGFKDIDAKNLEGGVGITFGYQDELLPAKILTDFKKEHEMLKITGGIFENSFISPERVEVLAKIPTRPELLAKMVGSLKMPISGLINILQGNLRNLVYLFNVIKENKVN